MRESPLPQEALRGPPGGLFGYIVQEGEVYTDGVSIGANALSLNSGATRDETGSLIPLRPCQQARMPRRCGRSVASWDSPRIPLFSRTTSSKRRGRRAVSFGVPVSGCAGMVKIR